jgi:hypothetical protein
MAPAAPAVSWISLSLTFFFLLGLVFTAVFVVRRHARGTSAGSKGTGHPGDSWARASVCIAIGAVVPVVAFTFTWLTSECPQFSGEIWQAPVIITLVCVISASLLARSLFGSGQRTMIRDESKPLIDEDAFDVVSRRG